MHKQNTHSNVIIIGAGAAGLMAALELGSGHKISVLEAGSRAGGRIRTFHDTGWPGPAEAGAEFVHGKLPVTLRLLKKAKLSYTPVQGDMFQVEGGSWRQTEEMIEGWDDLLKKMDGMKTDMTLQAFLDTYYAGAEHAALREHTVKYAQGFDLADPNLVSVKELAKEWTHEDDTNYRIDKGYSAMIDFMVQECIEAGVTMRYDTVIKEVKWENDRVEVVDAKGKSFFGQRLIITVPLGVLREDALMFSPALPLYKKAAAEMGFGSVVKLLLLFNQPFWKEYKNEIGFILSNETIPTWWTQEPDKDAVLTGWLGGPPAYDGRLLTEQEWLDRGLASLSVIFGIGEQQLRSMLLAARAFNWSDEPFALGAYSYPACGIEKNRALLNQPVNNTIYFAGEALYTGDHPGTVEAALVSGREAAKAVLSSLKS